MVSSSLKVYREPHPPTQILEPRVVAHEIRLVGNGGHVWISGLVHELEPFQGPFLVRPPRQAR